MRIPLSAPDIEEFEIEAVSAVLRSGRLSLGPKLSQFEQALADYIRAPFAIAVNSGTSGLQLCVRALGLSEGCEVIVAPFSFVAASNAILHERATPVFVDIDPNTLNLDPERIVPAITSRTRAIMVVHTFGRPAPMGVIMEIAAQHGLVVIEDACEALGAEWEGKRVGGLGAAGVFAFYPNKQITTGEGGMVVAQDPAIAARIRSMSNQGRSQPGEWFEHRELGFNYRLSELSCALGITQLGRLKSILERRAAVAAAYQRRLEKHPELILSDLSIADGLVSWFVYVVRLGEMFEQADRDWIAAELQARGIGCARYFAPIHLQPFYRQTFGFAPGDFPITERIAARTLALPFSNQITDEQLDEVCETLLALMAQRAPTS